MMEEEVLLVDWDVMEEKVFKEIYGYDKDTR